MKSTLLAATLAMFVATTATSFAAEEHPADAKAQKTETTKTETDKAKQPAKKKVKKHSHAEEKTGMPMPEHEAGMKEVTKDPSKHDHTIDKH
jgi:peptidoglycan hydrolase CwlO-like protein